MNRKLAENQLENESLTTSQQSLHTQVQQLIKEFDDVKSEKEACDFALRQEQAKLSSVTGFYRIVS